jgi:formate hydrogenlyase transcriptional activator
MAGKDNEQADSTLSGQQFEGLLMDLSASFVNVESEALDSCIHSALESIVDFLDVDRGSVGQFDGNLGQMRVTHSYAVEGIDPLSPTIGEEHVPYLTREIRAGKAFVCESLDNLPAVAGTEKEFGQSMGVKSAAAVPLAAAGSTLGVVAFATLRKERKWPDTIVRRLQAIGEIFANALLRRKKDTELAATYAEIELLKDRAERENAVWREQVVGQHPFEDIVGESQRLQEALHLVVQVAPTNSSVLLLGETGTGKELFATAIHARSARSERPFIRINCAALAPTLVESELFGHEKGAFSGALVSRPGRFELADGGTIVLDEIGELPLAIQAKLLRVLQNGDFERVGSSKTRHSDVRVIASTNRDLEAMVSNGTFRQDLFYRLGVFPITVPPLRDRREDIPLLVAYYVERLRGKLGKTIRRIPEQVIADLMVYEWPGNIRELKNIVERSIILSPGSTLALSSPSYGRQNSPAEPIGLRDNGETTGRTLTEVEREHIRAVCDYCNWRIEGNGNAAEMLDINPNTLRSRMKKLNISRPVKT